MEVAEPAVAAALAAGEFEAAAVGARALGLAARELHDVAVVRQHFVHSITYAERGALPVRAAEARLSLAAELVAMGRPAAALRELGRASRDLGDQHSRMHSQLALIYGRLGRYDDAVASNDRALAAADALGDTSAAALALANRGLAQAYRGDVVAAEDDLRRSRTLCGQIGEGFAALEATHNLAWVLGRRGRLPESLALFDEAELGLAEHGTQLGVYQLDRAEILLAAGLLHEARDLASRATVDLAQGGHEAELPEAMLLQARAALLAGDPGEAATAAEAADMAFRKQDRESWAITARAVALQARASLSGSPQLIEAALELTADLHARHLYDAEADVQLAAGRLAATLGEAELAHRHLGALASHRRRKADRARVHGWQAEHILRAVRGDRLGALSAARSALRALADARAGLGATDLHAASSLHGREVTRSALALALTGKPAQVLYWSEQARTSTLQYAPVRPPGDAELALDLERLRSVAVRRQQALLDDEPAHALHREQLALEESVRRRSRHAAATRAPVLATPSLHKVRAQLGDRRLVSLFAANGRLHALVVTRRRTELLDLASESEALLELRHLRLALRRSVLRQPRAQAAAQVAAERLDALLRRALRSDEPLVVVPHAGLAGLPWSLLPTVAGRVVEVSPSLSLWARPQDQRSRSGRVAVAGPGLPQAEREVAEIAPDYGNMVVLTESAASCAAVLKALDGAELAHLACHGRFRADNPLFSSLLLADGPLVVYDLERLTAAPEHVVLSACDSGRTGERAGEELLGLAAAFFSLGTRTLIASVVPVDDVATGRLMAALHQHWRGGLTPASALSAAQQDEPSPSAAAFVCLTAGQPQAVSG